METLASHLKKIMVIGLGFILFSCSQTPEKSELLGSIKDFEAKAKAAKFAKPDAALAESLIKNYTDFAKFYPTDTLAAEFVFRAGEVSRALGKYDQALQYLDEVINKFSQSQKAPYALFLKAFIFENDKKNLVNAKKFYTDFLSKYPTHEFADDAKSSIENLGKSPEELILMFEAKNKLKEDSLKREQAKK